MFNPASRKTVSVPQPEATLVSQMLLGWLDDERLLVGQGHNGPGSCDLLSWIPSQPQKPPVLLVKD